MWSWLPIFLSLPYFLPPLRLTLLPTALRSPVAILASRPTTAPPHRPTRSLGTRNLPSLSRLKILLSPRTKINVQHDPQLLLIILLLKVPKFQKFYTLPCTQSHVTITTAQPTPFQGFPAPRISPLPLSSFTPCTKIPLLLSSPNPLTALTSQILLTFQLSLYTSQPPSHSPATHDAKASQLSNSSWA